MLTFLLLSSVSLFSQETVKISGLVFGDYANKLGGTSTPPAGSSQYSAWNKADQQFQFRRIYLGADYTINENFAAQLLLEGNDGTYVIGSKNRQAFFTKRAFLEWKNLVPQASIFIGLSSTPTFDLMEREWNYRSVEKTLTDWRFNTTSSDFGIAVKGKIDADGMLSYHVMIANGAGQSAENDKYKRVMASLTIRPLKDLFIDLYGDYTDAVGSKPVSTYKITGGYKVADIHLGAEYSAQKQANAYIVKTINYDKELNGLSFYAWYPIAKPLNIFGRFDTFNPDINNSVSGFKETFATFGLDYMPDAKVHIIPNIWLNSFKDKSVANISKDADVVARLTFHFIFK